MARRHGSGCSRTHTLLLPGREASSGSEFEGEAISSEGGGEVVLFFPVSRVFP